MRRTGLLVVFAAFVVAGCEDGPEQIFEPNEGDPIEQNGYGSDVPIWVQDGAKPFSSGGGGSDVTGQSKFCDVEVQDVLIQGMVQKPILPDIGVGGIPIWDEDENGDMIPMWADNLLGVPEYDADGNVNNHKFCDSSAVYADAFVWGDDLDILVFFDQETRLVTDGVAYGNYQGSLTGTYTEVNDPGDAGDDVDVPVLLKLRNNIKIGDTELQNYPEWVEPENVTAMYKMIRETHFPNKQPDPLGDSYDCIADRKCKIIYRDDREHPEVAQDTQINFDDSGVILIIWADGTVGVVYTIPVRIAEFEFDATVDFNAAGTGDMMVSYESMCSLPMDGTTTWGDFVNDCVVGTTPAEKEETLARANYNVWAMRDMVSVEFEFAEVGFLRDLTSGGGAPPPVFSDGDRPEEQYGDTLNYLFFSLDLQADIPQFDPVVLAEGYKARLEAILFDSVAADVCTIPADCAGGWDCAPRDRCVSSSGEVGAFCGVDAAPNATTCAPTWTCTTESRCVDPAHPFADYDVQGASTVMLDPQFLDPTAPQSNDTLVDVDGLPWHPKVTSAIQGAYANMDDAEKMMVEGLDLSYPVYLVNPFLLEVMEALSLGASENGELVRAVATDNREFSIGIAHFLVNGEPHRMMVQYALNWDALTIIEVDRGANVSDDILSLAQGDNMYSNIGYFADAGADPDYLNISCAAATCDTDITLIDPPTCGCGLKVHRNDVDRQLDMISLEYWTPPDFSSLPPIPGFWTTARVPGFVVEDNTGFLRQIQPERWEFILADKVYLYGKESTFIFWVQAPQDGGQIARIEQSGFKGSVNMCEGPVTAADAPFAGCGDAALTDMATCEFANCFWWDGACTASIPLTIQADDHIRDRIQAWLDTIERWQAGKALDTFRQCDLVYNYSVNGNILDGVASLQNRVSFSVLDGRATSVAIWR